MGMAGATESIWTLDYPGTTVNQARSKLLVSLDAGTGVHTLTVPYICATLGKKPGLHLKARTGQVGSAAHRGSGVSLLVTESLIQRLAGFSKSKAREAESRHKAKSG